MQGCNQQRNRKVAADMFLTCLEPTWWHCVIIAENQPLVDRYD
jgi:hypothetical protein